MRSSKSRSRGNKNRNRSSGNNQNRVFDSSGPEGKVRGTPQQIIDKYTQLFRDATLSNDRVAAENFQQHAEHYSRLLSESQREADARREQHESQQRERQQQRDSARTDRVERQQKDGQPLADISPSSTLNPASGVADPVVDPGSEPQPGLVNSGSQSAEDIGLVETPESKPAPRKRNRKPRVKPDAPKATDPTLSTPASSAPVDTPVEG